MTAQPGRDEQPTPRESDGLLPCPFCGGEPELEREGTRRQSCIVICTDCNTKHESSDDGVRSGSSWNTRKAHASGWQDERPENGDWYLSIAPDKRFLKQAVHEVVVRDPQVGFDDGSWADLDAQMLTGAKWKRRETPEDPFASEVTHGK